MKQSEESDWLFGERQEVSGKCPFHVKQEAGDECSFHVKRTGRGAHAKIKPAWIG